MKNPTILKAENKDGFAFTFQIEKSAVEVADNQDLILNGVASTTNVDHDNERMDETALKRMVNVVNTKGVPLRWEHSKDANAILGTVFKGHVDERGQMHISARLDKTHPMAKELHDAVKRGEKYGLSVGGKILSAVKEMAENAGKYVKTFYDVLLDEVSVTKKPANYDAWLNTAVAKSASDKSYNRFLFENQQFDYLAQMSKSIPEGAWKTITKLPVKHTTKTMDPKKDEIKDETAEKSFVTKAQFDEFASGMTKAISGIAALLKADHVDAMDTTNPDEKKDQVETQQTAKARDGQEDAGGNGTEGDTKKEGDVPAKKQDNPSQDKPLDDTQQTAKAEEGDKEEDEIPIKEDTEKAEGDMNDGEMKDDAEKSGTEDVNPADEDKLPKNLKTAMKSIGDAIKVIDGLTKKMKGIKQITKSQTRKSNISEMDQFAIAVASCVDGLNERLEKSGKSIPGYTNALLEQIRNDSVLQGEIQKMMKEPGMKKSVAFGTPYMVTKDGKRHFLSATPVQEKVEKSEYNKTVDFKTLYKSKYSAIREAGAE